MLACRSCRNLASAAAVTGSVVCSPFPHCSVVVLQGVTLQLDIAARVAQCLQDNFPNCSSLELMGAYEPGAVMVLASSVRLHRITVENKNSLMVATDNQLLSILNLPCMRHLQYLMLDFMCDIDDLITLATSTPIPCLAFNCITFNMYVTPERRNELHGLLLGSVNDAVQAQPKHLVVKKLFVYSRTLQVVYGNHVLPLLLSLAHCIDHQSVGTLYMNCVDLREPAGCFAHILASFPCVSSTCEKLSSFQQFSA